MPAGKCGELAGDGQHPVSLDEIIDRTGLFLCVATDTRDFLAITRTQAYLPCNPAPSGYPDRLPHAGTPLWTAFPALPFYQPFSFKCCKNKSGWLREEDVFQRVKEADKRSDIRKTVFTNLPPASDVWSIECGCSSKFQVMPQAFPFLQMPKRYPHK